MATEANTNQDAANSDAATKVETEETNATGSGKNAGEQQDRTFSQADLDAAVQKRLAKQQKQFEADKAKWESEKDLSEVERLKAENARLKAGESERTLSSSLDSAFEKAGVSDAKTRRLLVGNYKSEAKANDKGEYENLLDVVKTAKEDYPDFFVKKAKGSADAAAKGGQVITDKDEFNQALRGALGF